MTSNNLRAVAVSPENYEKIKDLGRAGDSMNSVVTKLLQAYEKQKACNEIKKFERLPNKVILFTN